MARLILLVSVGIALGECAPATAEPSVSAAPVLSLGASLYPFDEHSEGPLVLAARIQTGSEQPGEGTQPAPVREFTPPAEESVDVFADEKEPAGAEDEGRQPCDREKLEKLQKQVIASHKGVFYKNDFSYLFDRCYNDWHLGDRLKRRCLAGWGVIDFGGQYRLRHHSERNIRGLGLTGRDDDFLLERWRLYSNVEIGRGVRFYAEMIDAQSSFEEFAPRPIEENRFDALNLFGDFRLYKSGKTELWARAGRQELLYGTQRLVSPLDWANTRRTFEGGKLMFTSENWDVDAFWVRPMQVRRDRFDTPDQSQELMGVYATSKLWEDRTWEFYFLRYLETDDRIAAAQPSFEYNTLGGRWERERCNRLYEAEAGVQWGEFGQVDHLAGFFTLGAGRKFPGAPCKPTLWAYYDWASGDETLGNGFDHLFPLAHRYLGWMDLYGRRNIEDINFLLTLEPSDRVKIFLWHHVFFLQDGDDVPYSVVMTPSVPLPGGSQYLGQEVDLALEWTVTPRTNLLVGYSHFFSGKFYDTNPSVPFSGDADFFYTQYTVNF